LIKKGDFKNIVFSGFKNKRYRVNDDLRAILWLDVGGIKICDKPNLW